MKYHICRALAVQQRSHTSPNVEEHKNNEGGGANAGGEEPTHPPTVSYIVWRLLVTYHEEPQQEHML